MKNKIFSIILLLPLLLVGCDSLFDKGDVEKTYDGPDQVGLFPLEDNNNVGINVTSTSIQVQLISKDGLATSDVPIAFSAAGGSTARATTDYSFSTASPVTIPAGSATAEIGIDFVVTTLDEVGNANIDSLRATGTYSGLTAATSGSGTGATFDVEVAEYGEIEEINIVSDIDSARVTGVYNGVTATGGIGTGATFNVTVPEYGAIQEIGSVSAADPLRTAGSYKRVTPSGGSGQFATVDVVIDSDGAATVEVIDPGIEYEVGDVLTISALDIGLTGSNVTFEVTSVSAIAQPTVTIEGGVRYADTDTVTIAAADLGGAGADLVLAITSVTPIAAPTVTVVNGGLGFGSSDTFTIAAADVGGAGADLTFEVIELTGSFAGNEVVLILQLDSATGARIAANLDSTNVFIAK